MDASNLFVITGGPGSGKSTRVSALRDRGLTTVEESGRVIIREEVSSGGDALPWVDRVQFAQLMLARDIDNFERAKGSLSPVVFDRGIPDVIGYLRLCDLPVPGVVEEAARNRFYNRIVFIAPHWPAIYAQDRERKQDAGEAERTCRMMRSVYSGYGYELVELPLASVEERVAFVLERMKS
jgi:predicted ATPase